MYNDNMKYYCNTKNKLSDSKQEAIKTMYPRIKIIEGFDELLKVIKEGDTVVFKNIADLSFKEKNNINDIKENYLKLLSYQVEIIFDKSSPCDSSIIQESYYELLNKGIVIADKDKVIDALLDLQIKSCINFTDSIANTQKYSILTASVIHGKSYGRPKGSGSKSEYSIKTKKYILENSLDFKGKMSDEECMKQGNISRATFYRYKKQLKEDE